MTKIVAQSTKKMMSALLNLQPHPKGTDYYQAAQNWYSEVYESLICSRDRYRLCTVLFGILLAMSVSAIALMMPLKHYFYRMIAVNQTTGEVTQLKEIEPDSVAHNWSVTRYFIHQYIQNRHAYSFEDIKRTFNLVLAMSDHLVAKNYSEQTIDSNPDSPITQLGQNKYRDVTVYSINQLNQDTALIRFKVTTHDRTNPNEMIKKDYQAVLKWHYQLSHDASLRDKNPLGFEVTYYQMTPVQPENE